MRRNNSVADFRSYDDSRVSSIYLNVYNQTLKLPGYEKFLQETAGRLQSTTIEGIRICKKQYNSDFVPYFEFDCLIRENLLSPTRRAPFTSSQYSGVKDGYGCLNSFSIDWDEYTPSTDEVLAFFSQNVGSERQYPIHMHGLMNMNTVKHGSSNKSLFVPWFLNKLINDQGLKQCRIETEARLLREARRFVDDPERNALFIEERNRLGKVGVIEGLKKVKDLPLEVLKEALNEFFCMDVMEDGFGE
jgi:hypothetical protein